MLSEDYILDSLPNGVIAADPRGGIVYINRRAKKILSVDPPKNTSVLSLLPHIGKVIAECLADKSPKAAIHLVENHIDLLVNVRLLSEQETVRGCICDFYEMSEVDYAVRKSDSYTSLNSELNAIFNSSSDGIWVCDGKGNVLRINSASEKLNGISAENIIGKNMKELVSEGWFDRSVTLEVLKTGRQVSLIQHSRNTDKILLTTGTPVPDEDGGIFLVVVNERDMTQLNALREELEQTRMETEKVRDRLMELSMMELKDQKFVAQSESMRQVLRIALKLARLDVSEILIRGESGIGKGLLAKLIHQNSRRSSEPFIQINCAAIPENLLEAELFGYEKGSFTGAREQGKAGLFELADNGTLFLDEIGDMPLSLQSKLLKYLDDYEVLRIGSLKPRKVCCTVITATNRNLESLIREHKFRKDLFYRLNSFTITIPPLRERTEDILELVNYFLTKFNQTYRLKKRITPAGFESLQSYSFPGNVRELRNIIKNSVIMSDGNVIDEFLKGLIGSEKQMIRKDTARIFCQSIRDEMFNYEKQRFQQASAEAVSTRDLAARLGISQPTVVRKLKKFGISL